MVVFGFISPEMHTVTDWHQKEAILTEGAHLILRSLRTNRSINITQPQCRELQLVKNILGRAVSYEVGFNNHPKKNGTKTTSYRCYVLSNYLMLMLIFLCEKRNRILHKENFKSKVQAKKLKNKHLHIFYNLFTTRAAPPCDNVTTYASLWLIAIQTSNLSMLIAFIPVVMYVQISCQWLLAAALTGQVFLST